MKSAVEVGAGETGWPPAVRRSPVRFEAVPLRTESRGAWEVVLEYEDEGSGPWLVDLGHRARFDYQDRHIDRQRPLGREVPPVPGRVAVSNGLMINRMNGSQASLWHLGPDPLPKPGDAAPPRSLTDITDSHCWLVLVGRETPAVFERVTDLDLFPPDRDAPFLTQGPVLRVPCQVVTAGPDAAFLAVGRGYGRSFVDALLCAGSECGLRPAGEDRFTRWVADRWGRP